MYVSDEELVHIVNHILNLENVIMPVTAGTETDTGEDVAQSLHDYLVNIVIENTGDPVLGLNLIDKASHLNNQELLNEIEFIRLIAD